MPNEIIKLIEFLDSGLLWIYFILMITIFYGICALLTWSFLKPLKLLGIPSIIAGIILVILRFGLEKISVNSFIDNLLPSLLQPLLVIGLTCITIGIMMLVAKKLLDKKNVKKDNDQNSKCTKDSNSDKAESIDNENNK